MFTVIAFIILAVVVWITCVEIRLHILYRRIEKFKKEKK